MGANRTEEGREGVVDSEGEASMETTMVAGGAGVDSAQQRVDRAQERGGEDAG